MPEQIKVAIVEDQRKLREGLAAIINGTPGYRIAGQFGSMEEALARFEWDAPDITLADIGLPGMNGIEGVRRLKARYPSLQILMLTVYDDNEHIFEAICSGASGYLLKDTPPTKLLEAIREVHRGGSPMTTHIARKVTQSFQKAGASPQPTENLSQREQEVLKGIPDRAAMLSIERPTSSEMGHPG